MLRRNSQQSTRFANSQQSLNTHHVSRFRFWRVGTLPLTIIALVAFNAFAYLAWFPKPPAKPDATWMRILDEGEFRVGIDPSFPPFESEDGMGNLRGLDIALAEEMARVWSEQNNTEVKVHFVYNGFDGLYDALLAGQYDVIISALPYDPKKTQDVRYTLAYFDGGPRLIVRASDATTKTYADLEGKRIGVELGSSGDSFARRWQRRLKYNVSMFNTPNDALRALTLGQVDAVFTDIIAFTDFARASNEVKIVGDPLVNELTVMAVRKDTPDLFAQINAVLIAMKQDGRLERLQNEWLVK
ncbi:MAG: amino acid ABC transporter substrate-binding protein [Chloroflexi bacterium]|nr:amino acid ABC transporter substrate-binding protein [Chloroflexota bacterium]